MEFEKAMNLVSDTYDKASYQMECNPNVYNKKGLRNITINKMDACLAIIRGVADLMKKLEDVEKKLAECEPVPAHWETVPNRVVEHGEMEIRGTAEWCSACKRADKDFKKWFDHCPNCGAIMDEGVFDDTETVCEADDGHGGTAE